MDRQYDAIKRSLLQMNADLRGEIERINDQLAKPPPGVASVVAHGLDERMVQLKSEVLDTLAARTEKDRKVTETVMGLRLNEMVGKHVDMHAEFRLRQLDERLGRLDERLSVMEAHVSALSSTLASSVAASMSAPQPPPPTPTQAPKAFHQQAGNIVIPELGLRQDDALSSTLAATTRIDLESLAPAPSMKPACVRQRVRFTARANQVAPAQEAPPPQLQPDATPFQPCNALALLQQAAGMGEK